MFDTAKILVVDDDPHVRETIRMALHDAGMDVSVAGNGSEGLAHFIVRPSDLIVLDVGMPGMDGLEMCRRIRRSSNVPILFLSARNEEIDRILGLEIGGDDYVVKPFSPRELIARIKAILKRDGSHFQGDAAEPLRHGDVSLDPTAHRAAFNGRPVGLTALEFGIFRGRRVQPAPDRRDGLRTQHAYLRPDSGQPYPQHPRQAARRRMRQQHRNRARRRFPPGALHGRLSGGPSNTVFGA
jgi:two-component system OmpR family response regulator